MRLFKACGLLLVFLGTWGPAWSAPPVLLHTPGYESPVHGDPDDLLMLAGTGFESADRVVYQAAQGSGPHPAGVPSTNAVDLGTVPIIQQGNPPDAITIRLPLEMARKTAYRLWVVTPRGEWSAPVMINDPRPQWITPSYAYSTAAIPGLQRVLRVVGRNLAGAAATEVRLNGVNTSYALGAGKPTNGIVDDYVTEVSLPDRLTPGLYSVSVRRGELGWVNLEDQKLEIRPDPPPLPTFSIADPRFGGCRPDDGADDSACLERAIEAAGHAGGGGIVSIPPGSWDVTTAANERSSATDGFVIPPHVQLRGAGREVSHIIRHGSFNRRPDALLSLTGDNTIVAIGFSEAGHFAEWAQARPVIQLGTVTGVAEADGKGSRAIKDVVIAENAFMHVGRAITDDPARALVRLFILNNEFGAYADAIGFPGSSGDAEPFRIDDTILRGNRFVPGSYIDLAAHQGSMATGLGAGHHVDFSDNVADGASDENLQEPDDPNGFRAAFFWNTNNNVEQTLIAANHVACSGDKDGDGEAISFDQSGETYAFNGAAPVAAAGRDQVTVRTTLFQDRSGRPFPATYYVGHWIKLVSGPGRGQTRRITGYTGDSAAGTVTFHVEPAWDVLPAAGGGRVVVGRQYWQVYVVGNDIEHRNPPCRKSNRTGPGGGFISVWAPSADVVVEGNQQRDTNGIQFTQGYSLEAASCPRCPNVLYYQTALEIRGNVIDGEYDWSIDCGHGGILGSFGASPTPESTPPVVGIGISISHNVIAHADALRGGAIDFPMTTSQGPPPGDWPLIENLLVFHNELRDIYGPPPRPKCFLGQLDRTAVRLEGKDNIRDTVLYANHCEHVSSFLLDHGKDTQRICSAKGGGTPGLEELCECRAGGR